MVLIASVEIFIVTQVSSSAKKNLFVFRLGKNLRLVFILECETLFPEVGLLPVTWHTLAMIRQNFGRQRSLKLSNNQKQIVVFLN